MIKIEDYPIFARHCSTLKETSKDKHGENIAFMTESNLEIIDFDGVKDEYICTLNLLETPKSNDALYLNLEGKWTFIEFKNGKINSNEKFRIRKKIFDSLLIFTDIVEKGISYTRKNMEYILVYNEEKNNDDKSDIEVSESRDKIAKSFIKKGGEHYIKYGLEAFQNYCFFKVHTYTKSEFNEKFILKNIRN